MSESFYKLRTPRNYAENQGIWEVVWIGIFMPFDVVCGVDSVPPDNGNYEKYKKTHWWVCPKTSSSMWFYASISDFMQVPTKEFTTLEKAIEFCVNWRRKWLEKELSITI